jgi:trans-aconitate 2-methyltransferase
MPDAPPEPPRYTFGDTALAARRLALLAEVLAVPSRAFLQDATPPNPRVALDLGCGPGYTTALVAEATGASRTVGFEASAAFVGAARRSFPGLEFAVHDVTVTPFPVAEPNLVFARLVLAHLPDPARQARTWAYQLAPGGRLLLDELDSLDAPDPVLGRYEDLVSAVVADRGGPMHAGPLLADFSDGPDVATRSSAASTLAVPVPVAARLYAMNLEVWRQGLFAHLHFAGAELDDLARGLAELIRTGQGHVDWRLRHVVVERHG